MTKFSYRKFFRSFFFAVRGLIRLIETEQNARIHLVASLILAACSYVFHLSRVEVAVLFFAVVLVFAVEIINTAIEKVLDIVHPENHEQIAYVKDALAGAVPIAALIAAGVGFFVFYPHIKALWF